MEDLISFPPDLFRGRHRGCTPKNHKLPLIGNYRTITSETDGFVLVCSCNNLLIDVH